MPTIRGRLREVRRGWPRPVRALTAKAVVLPGLVVVVLVGGFLGYGAWTRGPTHFAWGGAWLGSKQSAGGGITAEPGDVWATLPRTGNYLFTGSGHEKADLGLISLCDWDVGPSIRLDVHGITPVPGSPFTHRVDFDWILNAGHDDVRYIWQMSPRGVGIAFIGADVTCAGIQKNDDSAYAPVVRRFPFPLIVGASWSGISSSSTRKESFRARVVSSASMYVAGTSCETWEIDNHIDISGGQQGTRDETWWYAPSLGMAVKIHIRTAVRQSGADFSSDYTLAMERLPAER